MMTLPWASVGARLNLPRDLEIAYAVGRMGVVTVSDTYALWYKSPNTCRVGFGRLARLGLIRPFPRPDPRAPAWHSLTRAGLEWTAEQSGCDARELRSVDSIRRTNLVALSARNRLWTSLVLACRHSPGIRIGRFLPEWRLRPETPPDQRLVPDAMLALTAGGEGNARRSDWALELDNATERLSVWRTKATKYAAIRSGGHLYGVSRWRMLAVVPSIRRAMTVATAIVAGGGGAFSYVAVAASLDRGRALDCSLWPCLSLASDPGAQPSASLADGLATAISDADQRRRSAADRGEDPQTREVSP